MRFVGPVKRVVIIHQLEDNLEASGSKNSLGPPNTEMWSMEVCLLSLSLSLSSGSN